MYRDNAHHSFNSISVDDEIRSLEARLTALRRHDDSAYEKALIRTYESMLEERKRAIGHTTT
jgi:hypothetical protein